MRSRWERLLDWLIPFRVVGRRLDAMAEANERLAANLERLADEWRR